MFSCPVPIDFLLESSWFLGPSLLPDSVVGIALTSFPRSVPKNSKLLDKMHLKSLVAAIAAGQLAAAQELMRFGCSQLTIDRIDPLVNPGSLPSPHMHQARVPQL